MVSPALPGSAASAIARRLDRLTPDQRAAATAEPGPILCVAPAGSGKTTTLIARICWLLASGHAGAGEITAVTFNKRAAVELAGRLGTALAELADPPPDVRIRTFHALAREILLDDGRSVEPLVDRLAILRSVRPAADAAELGRLDTAISKLKLDLGVTAAQVAADPDAGPTARTFVDYELAVAATGGLDFDDLLVRALDLLGGEDPAATAALRRWQARCAHLLIDESQDLDRSQLRLALLLAAPANRIFLVGDDDQSIYGWRLADVRRLLSLAGTALPGLRRVDLVTNFRCPAPVIDRSVRLVEHNTERFAKTILARDGASGQLRLARSNGDDVDRIEAVLRSWPDDGGSRAVLARTNRELVPAALAAVRLGLPFSAAELELPLDAPIVDRLLAAAASGPPGRPLLRCLADARLPSEADPEAVAGAVAIRQAVLAWAVPFADVPSFAAAIDAARGAVVDLRREDATLTLATAHGTKGLEFDHVAVIGLEAGRFPSARSIADSPEPARTLEEERRLAYVAWTRARRSLTLLFDPGAPSRFLLEAFDPEELGVVPAAA